MTTFSTAVQRHFEYLETEFDLLREEHSDPVGESVLYVGDPVSVVVRQQRRDDYVTANLVASFGAVPDLATMAYVPLQSLAQGTPGAAHLAGIAEDPSAGDALLGRQADAIRPFLERASNGDLTDFETYANRMRAQYPGLPGVDWWAHPAIAALESSDP